MRDQVGYCRFTSIEKAERRSDVLCYVVQYGSSGDGYCLDSLCKFAGMDRIVNLDGWTLNEKEQVHCSPNTSFGNTVCRKCRNSAPFNQTIIQRNVMYLHAWSRRMLTGSTSCRASATVPEAGWVNKVLYRQGF